MKKFPKTLIAVVFAVSLSGCSAADDRNANVGTTNTAVNADANPTRDDVEEFEMVVKLPFHPEEVTWREEKMGKQIGDERPPGPTDRKLTAVIQFTKDEANQIVAQAEKVKPAAPASMNAETWFPAELKAMTEISGDQTLKGSSYAANDFFQPPYLEGKLTRVENSNYFVLELFTK